MNMTAQLTVSLFAGVRFMHFERCRLWSFKNNWNNAHVCVEDLASAGFYRPDEDECGSKQEWTDLVRCHFGGCQLFSWEEGDHPWTEHMKHFPLCPFINGDVTTNIPLSA